jgi:trimeric autotransporter adhesin
MGWVDWENVWQRDRKGKSGPFEIARVVVRVDHVASFIVNANHGVPIRLAKLARFFENSVHMKTTTLQLRKLMNRSPLRCACLLIPLVLGWFALSPTAQAVCQEGCLTNQNTVLGEDALFSNTTGDDNTATGFAALFSNTTGNNNTAIGVNALLSNTTGGSNTATGVHALFSNTTGIANTATGVEALFRNTDGGANTATGANALAFNTNGSSNTATGNSALFLNTTGSSNTANGLAALHNNTTGFNNTAIGVDALHSNTTGNYNTASGQGSLNSNTTGRNNTANGQNALRNNTSGSFNIALGENAGFNLTTGSNNIEIGNRGVAGETKTIRIGRQGTQTATYIAGISGATVPTGVAVIVDDSGHLGTTTSSARFKDAIKPMEKASEAILALKPVSFRYKRELDPNGIPQFGLVAEDVEKVNPALVAHDADGKAYTVRYEAVNAMLLNEFLKEHRRNEAQQKQIEALTAMVKEQAAQIQKVTAQLEVNKTAPRIVLNNQ